MLEGGHNSRVLERKDREADIHHKSHCLDGAEQAGTEGTTLPCKECWYQDKISHTIKKKITCPIFDEHAKILTTLKYEAEE